MFGVILALIFSCFSHLNKAFFLIRFIDNESKKLLKHKITSSKLSDPQAINEISKEKKDTIRISFTQIISPLTDHFLSDIIISGSDRIPKLGRIYWLNGFLSLFLTTLSAFILLHFNDFKVSLNSISYTILSMICLVGISFWMFYFQVFKKATFEQRKNEEINMLESILNIIKEEVLEFREKHGQKNQTFNFLIQVQKLFFKFLSSNSKNEFSLHIADKKHEVKKILKKYPFTNYIREWTLLIFLSIAEYDAQCKFEPKIIKKDISSITIWKELSLNIIKTQKILEAIKNKSEYLTHFLDIYDSTLSDEPFIGHHLHQVWYLYYCLNKLVNLEKKSQYQLLKAYFGEITEQSSEE